MLFGLGVTFSFRHLRHFLVQSKVADFITTLRLVKMEPGIVNWFGAKAERGDLGPLTFTAKRYAAQIHGAFFLGVGGVGGYVSACCGAAAHSAIALATESPAFRIHLTPGAPQKVGMESQLFILFSKIATRGHSPVLLFGFLFLSSLLAFQISVIHEHAGSRAAAALKAWE